MSEFSMRSSGIFLLSLLLLTNADAAENPWLFELGMGIAEIDSQLELRPDEIKNCYTLPPGPTLSCRELITSGFESQATAKLGIGYYVGENWGVSAYSAPFRSLILV